MQVTGLIKEVYPSLKDGVQRTWTKDDLTYEFWTAIIAVPIPSNSPTPQHDMVIAEFARLVTPGNTPLPYADFIGRENMSIKLYFSIREYEGRKYQTIKMGDVNVKAQ